MRISRIDAPLSACRENKIYILENERNMTVSVMNYGATVLSVVVPDRLGKNENVVLSLAALEDYIESDCCAGAALGPVAGRVRGGQLPVAGLQYQLDRNDGQNTLHGGTHGLSHFPWKEKKTTQSNERVSVTMTAFLCDGLDGFPGDRTIDVQYTLTDRTLRIDYTATTTELTWISLSNHSYFNLSGNFASSALEQYLQIDSENVLFNDEEHLPVSCEHVNGTPFDFRTEKKIRESLMEFPDDRQLKNALGYNNAYDVRNARTYAVSLADRASGRSVRIATDYPAVVFYSGGYLDGRTRLAGGGSAKAGCALAFEAQKFPDSVHLGLMPEQYLVPGMSEHHFISYTFAMEVI